jgi:hypothetical protein
MVKDTGLLVVAVELEEVLLQHQHMVGVELEPQEIVLQDHLLVVEMVHIHKDLTDLQIPAAVAAEVKEVQHHPISSIRVETADLVSSSSHTTPDK